MDGKVVQLSLREFTDKLLPVPHELVSALFPENRMAAIKEAFADVVEQYGTRPWDDERYRDPEEQLAAEFTQIVKEHILIDVAGKAFIQSEGSISSSSVVESTGVPGPGQQGTSLVDKVPGDVMKVFAQPRSSGRYYDRHEVRRLDGEPGPQDHAEDDGEEMDDSIRSTAALFLSAEVQSELDPDQPNWAHQRAFVQFVREGAHNDPFDFGPMPWGMTSSNVSRARVPSDLRPFERGTREQVMVDYRERIRNQMQSHADHVALYQHRTAVLAVVVSRRAFRVVRWDPSGVCVSERVDYVRNARALVEVLLAFVARGNEGLGCDPTATRLRKGEGDYELMDRLVDEGGWRVPVLSWEEGTLLPSSIPAQAYATVIPGAPPNLDGHIYEYLVDHAQCDSSPCGEADNPPTNVMTTTATHRFLKDGAFIFQYVLDAFRRSLARGLPRYSLRIGSDEFLIGAPLYFAMRFGATRGYVAFHKQSARFVLLKDAWRPRSHCHGFGLGSEGEGEGEGEILRRLNEDGISNVPTLVCCGIVGGQERSTSEAENAPRGVKRIRNNLSEEEMRLTGDHVHYRIALKEVWLPLDVCTSSHQLVRVIGNCIEAHYDAMEKSKLIHGNISNESIAILPSFVEPEGGDGTSLRVVWRGMLVDWEFAAPHGADPFTPPRERTPAARRHMSVALLTDASHIAQTADEIESFFYAVLHHAIRFFPHNVHTTDFINTTFVPATRQSDGAILCPMNKEFVVAEHGVLKLRGKKVVFYQSRQSGICNAPFNRLLATMLRWLKARYDVLEYETSPPHSLIPASASMSTSDGGLASKREGAEHGPCGEATVIAHVPSVDTEDDSARPSGETYELASRVDDYEAIRKLFEEVKHMDWPENDVVEDQWSPQGLRRFG